MNKPRTSGSSGIYRILRGLLIRHPLALAILSIALIAFSYFSWQLIENTRLFRELSDHERPIELWMSPRFVAHSWDLSRREMIKVMRLNGDTKKPPRTIGEVLTQSELTLEQLMLRVEVARDCDDLDWFDFDFDFDDDEDVDDDASAQDQTNQREAARAEICDNNPTDSRDAQKQRQR